VGSNGIIKMTYSSLRGAVEVEVANITTKVITRRNRLDTESMLLLKKDFDGDILG